MVELLVALLVIVVLGGLAHSLIDRAPFITEPIRSYALYIVYGIVVIALVVYVLLPLIRFAAGTLGPP